MSWGVGKDNRQRPALTCARKDGAPRPTLNADFPRAARASSGTGRLPATARRRPLPVAGPEPRPKVVAGLPRPRARGEGSCVEGADVGSVEKPFAGGHQSGPPKAGGAGCRVPAPGAGLSSGLSWGRATRRPACASATSEGINQALPKGARGGRRRPSAEGGTRRASGTLVGARPRARSDRDLPLPPPAERSLLFFLSRLTSASLLGPESPPLSGLGRLQTAPATRPGRATPLLPAPTLSSPGRL